MPYGGESRRRYQSIVDFRVVSMCISTRSQNGTEHMTTENSTYKKDVQHALKIGRFILSSIGIWPTAPSMLGKILPKIAIVLGNFALGFAIVPCCLHMILEQSDFTIRLKLFGLLSFCVTNVMKFCALAARRSEIRYCVDHIISDWRQVQRRGDREVMLKYARHGRNLTLLCVTFMYSGGIIYHTVLPFSAERIVNEWNETLKPVVYPTYSQLFNVQKSPVYELVYIAHCMCGYTMYAVTSGACGLAAMFAMHACGQVEMLLTRLEALPVTDGSRGGKKRKLAAIVDYHLRILGFLMIVGEALQEVCFIEFVGSTFMICLLEFYCLKDWEDNNTLSLTTYALLLVSFSFNIFILCYIGECLTEQTGKIGPKCFMIDWYELPVKTIRGLILVIAMSNNPVKLSAGKMADLSLCTFGNILKTSVAYLSFLRTVV